MKQKDEYNDKGTSRYNLTINDEKHKMKRTS